MLKYIHLSVISKRLNSTKSTSKSTFEQCIDLVKQNDYENFVCSLFLKDNVRPTAFVIRAFNVKVAKAIEHSSKVDIARSKLIFWRDTIDKCYLDDYKIVPKEPVALELYKVIKQSNLSKRYFQTLIKTRNDHLKVNSFPSLEQMENYADGTVSNVYYLLLEASGNKDLRADHAASHFGKAQGLCQLLRGVPFIPSTNWITLPQDLLSKHRISHEDLIRGKNSDALKEVVFEVATRAHQHLEKGLSLADQLPKDMRRILLPHVPVKDYLNELLKVDCDIFSNYLQQRKKLWLVTLWWSNFKLK